MYAGARNIVYKEGAGMHAEAKSKIIAVWAAFVVLLVLLAFIGWRLVYKPDERFKTTEAFDKMEVSQIKIINDEGKTIKLKAKIADEDEERLAGFQNIGEGVIEKALILFVFPYEITGKFHMRNVVAPLDIAFIKADGTIIEILRMDPSPTQLYGPQSSFKYALEARAGFFKEKKISAGSSKLVVDSISK